MRVPQKSAMFSAAAVLAVTLLSTAFVSPLRADVLRRVVVTTYLRDGPSVQYRPVDEAQTGERVSVRGCAKGWCNVVYGGVSGYIVQAVLAPLAAGAAPAQSSRCFTDREAGYRGGRDVRFCAAQTPAP